MQQLGLQLHSYEARMLIFARSLSSDIALL